MEKEKEVEKKEELNEEVKAEAAVPAKFKDLVEKIEQLSVLELNELVKVLESKFGVSAGAMMAPAAGGTGAEATDGEEATLTVNLASFGEQKVAVIKVVKEILGLGLKEAKDLVESAPAKLKEGVSKEEAGEIKKKIEEAGGQVELK